MESFMVSWWIWALCGVLLLLGEFLTPGGFYQFFFGIGALAVAIIDAAGIHWPLTAQIGLFLVLSIGSLVALRKPLRMKFGQERETEVDQIEGETAVTMEEIAAGAIGKAELRGAVWNARNVGDALIPASQRCRVERVNGLTLDIRA